MMRILEIIPNMGMGGAQIMAKDLAIALKGSENDVRLLVMSDNPGNNVTKELEHACIKSYWYRKRSTKRYIGRKINLFRYIVRTMADFRPDIVHVHLDYRYLWLIALIFNFRIIETIHTEPKFLNNLSFRVVIKILRRKQLIVPVCLTEINAEQMCELYGFKKNEICIIPNPVDYKKFSQRNKRKDQQCIKFVFASRFSEEKRHDILLKAFAKVVSNVPNCKLLLAGDGETLAQTVSLSKDLHIEETVSFLGYVEDMPTLLSDSDICVISSETESFSLFLVECMASGLPVIATYVGGMRDIIEDNGIFVKAGDVSSLSNAMIELALDRAKRERMGCISAQLAKKYDIDFVADKYLELFKKLTVV